MEEQPLQIPNPHYKRIFAADLSGEVQEIPPEPHSPRHVRPHFTIQFGEADEYYFEPGAPERAFNVTQGQWEVSADGTNIHKQILAREQERRQKRGK